MDTSEKQGADRFWRAMIGDDGLALIMADVVRQHVRDGAPEVQIQDWLIEADFGTDLETIVARHPVVRASEPAYWSGQYKLFAPDGSASWLWITSRSITLDGRPVQDAAMADRTLTFTQDDRRYALSFSDSLDRVGQAAPEQRYPAAFDLDAAGIGAGKHVGPRVEGTSTAKDGKQAVLNGALGVFSRRALAALAATDEIGHWAGTYEVLGRSATDTKQWLPMAALAIAEDGNATFGDAVTQEPFQNNRLKGTSKEGALDIQFYESGGLKYFSGTVTNAGAARDVIGRAVKVPPGAQGLTITNTSLPGARKGKPYEVQLQAANVPVGTTATWSPVTVGPLSVAQLPPGLQLSPQGMLSGWPTTSGVFVTGVTATAGTFSVTNTYSMDVQDDEKMPVWGSWVDWGRNIGAFIIGILIPLMLYRLNTLKEKKKGAGGDQEIRKAAHDITKDLDRLDHVKDDLEIADKAAKLLEKTEDQRRNVQDRLKDIEEQAEKLAERKEQLKEEKKKLDRARKNAEAREKKARENAEKAATEAEREAFEKEAEKAKKEAESAESGGLIIEKSESEDDSHSAEMEERGKNEKPKEDLKKKGKD